MQKKDRLGIRIAGPAGLGMNSVMDIVANAFSELGYNIITDSEYQSIIKGGLNFYDVNICSDFPYIMRKIDILIGLDAKNIIPNLEDLSRGGIIIVSQKTLAGLKKIQSDIEEKFRIIALEINDKYENTYLVAVLSGILGVDSKNFEPIIRKVFLKKGFEVVEKNIKILHDFAEFGRNFYVDLLPELNENASPKKISYGNRMIAYGAIASELEFYSAYPMTPASSILTEIINSKKIPYLQAEDEIAVINAALGASFTGARSMVGTSGGGFALMTEALSFAAQAEIPIVAILSQRAGPSTGAPTFHEQGEILYATRPTFGDIENIVMVPSTLEEAYFMAGQSLNLAQKYQMTVIFLTDKQFSEGKVTIGELQAASVDRGKISENPGADYARYQLTEDGVSPYVRVGVENGDFIATSYEHDEYGETSESSDMKIKMTEKRAKKVGYLFEKEKISGFEVINHRAKKKIITLSFTRYTAEYFVKNNPEWGLIIIKFLSPVDERLRGEIEKCDEVVFVENNFSGQLEALLSEKLGLKYLPNTKITHKRKYNLLPFYYEDFLELL
ncbi:MAG: 2-oxoacid:acceptor oxidoreductase family protein [Candidatus Altimarinota bacterium]